MYRLIMFALCLFCAYNAHRFFTTWDTLTLFVVLMAVASALFLFLGVRK